MQQILVYGDSLSWGIIPDTRQRFAFSQRWPGVMELKLAAMGKSVRVIEDCLNGRRTVWHDPFKLGRSGIEGIEQRIEVNSPLSLVMLFLGTNDFQNTHTNTPWHSAQGLRSIVSAIRKAPVEPGMPVPDIMLIAPPEMQKPKGAIAPKFADGEIKAKGLAAAIEQVAVEEQCHYFNAGMVTASSVVDGVHLDQNQHLKLGMALAKAIFPLIAPNQNS